MRRTTPMLCGLAVSILISAAVVAGRAQDPAPMTPPPPYRNIEILRGVSAEEMDLIMRAMNQSLGVDCDHCHVPGRWELDDRPAKETAREMMRMVAASGETDFATLDTPSCWTCHRGARVPETAPERPAPRPDLESAAIAAAFSSETRPSGEIYRNIRIFRDLPANRLREVMIDYSRALGVGCGHCHVPGDWASDAEVTKPLTRRMVEIETGLEQEFFGGRNVLSCWVCHRGRRTPETTVP